MTANIFALPVDIKPGSLVTKECGAEAKKSMQYFIERAFGGESSLILLMLVHNRVEEKRMWLPKKRPNQLKTKNQTRKNKTEPKVIKTWQQGEHTSRWANQKKRRSNESVWPKRDEQPKMAHNRQIVCWWCWWAKMTKMEPGCVLAGHAQHGLDEEEEKKKKVTWKETKNWSLFLMLLFSDAQLLKEKVERNPNVKDAVYELYSSGNQVQHACWGSCL